MKENFFSSIPIQKISPGMTVSYSRTITDADVRAYAELSGDLNPVHLSEEYASSSRFGKRIAHGLMSAGFFSALFGTRLPGPGCVYVSQSLNFKRPVYIGDTVVANAKVVSVDLARHRVFFETVCMVGSKVVIIGEAEIYIPQDKR